MKGAQNSLAYYHACFSLLIVPGVEPFNREKSAELLCVFSVVGHLRAYENGRLKCTTGGLWSTAQNNLGIMRGNFRKFPNSPFWLL